jgi:hypothetical protein
MVIEMKDIETVIEMKEYRDGNRDEGISRRR